MARLNTRPSTVISSRYGSETPRPQDSSDQENRDPAVTARQKGKRRAMPPPPVSTGRDSLPTPHSNDSDAGRGQKRKRDAMLASQRQHYSDDEEEKFNKYFDPNQDPEWRREVKKQSRALDREFHETRDDLLRENGDGLLDLVQRANDTFKDVKQTADATLDSRLLVSVSGLGFKKSAQLVLGDTSSGVDVDEFLSKCISYMRYGSPLGRSNSGAGDSRTQQARRASQRARRNSNFEDDDDDFIGAALDWSFLGHHACFPYNSRPPCPSFLLGPLSVEKKVRAQTQRRARQQRDAGGREARPENIGAQDLQQSDENGLTKICQRIKKGLAKHCERAERSLEREGFTSLEELKTDRGKAALKRARVSSNGNPSLFEFVVNPRSFGQTVENMFYVSFLIKEGVVRIENDDDELPTLAPAEPRTLREQEEVRRQHGSKAAQKHQAVFALDYKTWQRLVQAFHIQEPIIPHREDEGQSTQALGRTGWYG